MKKIKLLSLALATLAIAGTGCLKDKGYDNHVYGTNDPDASPAGIGFTMGTGYHVTTGLNVSPTPQSIDTAAVMVALLSGAPASSDIHVHIAALPLDSVLNAGLEPLDPALYTIPTEIVIPAGQRRMYLNIPVSNTTALDPNTHYGIGVMITSVDGPYILASNEKMILLEINIKNQYDGDYTANGYFYHPTAPRPMDDIPKTLSTVSATAVSCDLGDLGAPNGYVAIFDVDPITNHVTVSAAPGAAGAPYVQFDNGLPTTNPGYTPQWPGSPECNNIYDPVEHAFKMRYGYIGGTGYRVSEEIIKLN